MTCHAHAASPLLRRPDRSRHKTAAAVRADVEQLCLHAVRAEGALIGADPSLGRRGRQVLVAIFAVGTKLQGHGGLVALIRDCIIARSAEKQMPNFPRFAPRSSSSPRMAADHRASSFSGSRALSFSRSSTIEECTCATLG